MKESNEPTVTEPTQVGCTNRQIREGKGLRRPYHLLLTYWQLKIWGVDSNQSTYSLVSTLHCNGYFQTQGHTDLWDTKQNIK